MRDEQSPAGTTAYSAGLMADAPLVGGLISRFVAAFGRWRRGRRS
jgi:hypothetical protein